MPCRLIRRVLFTSLRVGETVTETALVSLLSWFRATALLNVAGTVGFNGPALTLPAGDCRSAWLALMETTRRLIIRVVRRVIGGFIWAVMGPPGWASECRCAGVGRQW